MKIHKRVGFLGFFEHSPGPATECEVVINLVHLASKSVAQQQPRKPHQCGPSGTSKRQSLLTVINSPSSSTNVGNRGLNFFVSNCLKKIVIQLLCWDEKKMFQICANSKKRSFCYAVQLICKILDHVTDIVPIKTCVHAVPSTIFSLFEYNMQREIKTCSHFKDAINFGCAIRNLFRKK